MNTNTYIVLKDKYKLLPRRNVCLWTCLTLASILASPLTWAWTMEEWSTTPHASQHILQEKRDQGIPSNYTTKQFLPFSFTLGISSAGFAEKQVVSAQSKVEEGIQQYIENAILFILSGEVNKLTSHLLFDFALKWTESAHRTLLSCSAAVSNIFPHLPSSGWSALDATEAHWGSRKASQKILDLKNISWWICWRIQVVPYDWKAE